MAASRQEPRSPTRHGENAHRAPSAGRPDATCISTMDLADERNAEDMTKHRTQDESQLADGEIQLSTNKQLPCSTQPSQKSLDRTTTKQPSPVPPPSFAPPPPAPPSPPPAPLPRALTARLYTSHALSTWHSRLFEMGATLFLAALYPATLAPLSVYALVRSAAAIVLAPAVGAWIDAGDRLRVVRWSILGQRAAVVGSCGAFWGMGWDGRGGEGAAGVGGRARAGLFAVVCLLACVEKLCAVMNLVTVERDWVVVIAAGDEAARQVLNARMRRIDLFCKLVGPLVVSLINGASTIVAIWVTLGMNVASVLVEYICIAKVYKMVPALRRVPAASSAAGGEAGLGPSARNTAPRGTSRRSDAAAWLRATFNRLLPLKSIPFYLQHPVFLPSISLSLLYLTVLSFSGQMVTFLLASGYTSIHVGIARTVSTVFELSATWIAPRVMKRIGAVRGGIWFLSWQMAWLAGGIAWFFADGEGKGRKTVLAVSGLAGGVILSRVGLWGFDLCAQTIIQDAVDVDRRGAFSTVEASFQNLFELLSYASTIIFSRPDQFRWPVVLSAAAVYAAGGLYAGFVRSRRGHLLHYPACFSPSFEAYYERRAF